MNQPPHKKCHVVTLFYLQARYFNQPYAPMSICTGRGKDGKTDLLFGKRIAKADARVEVGGAIDELNAWIGVVRSGAVPEEVKELLAKIQQHLIAIMGEIATLEEDLSKYAGKGYSRLTEEDQEWIYGCIKNTESGKNIKFRGWAVPGAEGSQSAAFLDVCRTTCRRAERLCWQWDEKNTYLLHKRYLNNLSDLFWVLARQGECADS